MKFLSLKINIMVNIDKPQSTDKLEKKNNYFEFNINENIAVELTDYWKKVINDKEVSFLKSLPTLSRISEDIRKKYSDWDIFNVENYVKEEIMPKYDGICEFQLWDFMNKFGSELYMGNKKLFVNNNIYFKEREESEFGNWAKRVSEEMAENLMTVLKD